MLKDSGSQADFEALVSITQPKTSQLLSDDTLPADRTLCEWMPAVSARLLAAVAGRDESGIGDQCLTRSGVLVGRATAALVAMQSESVEFDGGVVGAEDYAHQAG